MFKRQSIILNFFGKATKPPAPKQSRKDQPNANKEPPDSQVRAAVVVDASAIIEDEWQGEFELHDEDNSLSDDDVEKGSKATGLPTAEQFKSHQATHSWSYLWLRKL